MEKADIKSKPKFQPWNHEEFLSDPRVRAMTYIQKWMYCFLLHEAFFSSDRPYLLDDDNVLWALAGCKSKSQWTENMIPVRAMFEAIVLKGKHLLVNKRAARDWKKLEDDRKGKVAQAVKAGKASAESRRNSRSTSVEQTLNEKQPREVKGSEEKLSQAKLNEGSNPLGWPEEFMAAEKTVRKRLAKAWQEVKNCNTLILDIHRNWMDSWKNIVDQCSPDAIETVFRQWAVEEGDGRAKWPLHDFIKAWDNYTTRNPNLIGKQGPTGPSAEEIEKAREIVRAGGYEKLFDDQLKDDKYASIKTVLERALSEHLAIQEARKVYGSGAPAPAAPTGGGMEDYLAQLENEKTKD